MRFRGVMADAFTYNHLVTACKDGSWERALDLVRQLDEAHLEVSSVTFNGVIVACGNGGQLNKALGVLQVGCFHCLVRNALHHGRVIASFRRPGFYSPCSTEGAVRLSELER